MLELSIGEDHSLSAFIDINQGGAPSLWALGVTVYAVVGQVSFRAGEPLKVGKVPLEDRVPTTKPG